MSGDEAVLVRRECLERAPRAEWADKARKLEDLGYSALTVPDHLADIFAPMPALVAAAEATKRLQVGTNVLNNDFRHPVLVAREAATVDLLTDGRLQLGVGAGHMKSEYDEAGLSFNHGGTRVERLAEAVAIMKGLLEGQPVTFAGRHYRVPDHKIYPLPVQRPHPPILIGGNGQQLLSVLRHNWARLGRRRPDALSTGRARKRTGGQGSAAQGS